MMMKFKEKLSAFFYGRNGVDQLYRFHLILLVAMLVLSMIFRLFEDTMFVGTVFSALSTALAVYMFFRVLSKNVVARRAENSKYLAVQGRVTGWFALQKRRFRERKTHSFKKCPGCKKTVRLKKVKGEHTVRCPMCSTTFKVKF